MEPIICTASNKVTTFYLDVSQSIEMHKMNSVDLPWQSKRTWQYRVYRSDPPDLNDDFYSGTFVEILEGLEIQCTEIFANKPHYLHKGITPQVFQHVTKLTGMTLFSSSNLDSKKRFARESRKPSATAVWESLCKSDKAIYHSSEDRYEYVRE